jgi:hypothetical protein
MAPLLDYLAVASRNSMGSLIGDIAWALAFTHDANQRFTPI